MNLLNILAVGVAVPLVNLIKKSFGIKGRMALWLSFVVSVGLSTGVFFLNGEFALTEFLGILATIFAGAQAVYNVVKNVSRT